MAASASPSAIDELVAAIEHAIPLGRIFGVCGSQRLQEPLGFMDRIRGGPVVLPLPLKPLARAAAASDLDGEFHDSRLTPLPSRNAIQRVTAQISRRSDRIAVRSFAA
jgi:hypothetical protein